MSLLLILIHFIYRVIFGVGICKVTVGRRSFSLRNDPSLRDVRILISTRYREQHGRYPIVLV